MISSKKMLKEFEKSDQNQGRDILIDSKFQNSRSAKLQPADSKRRACDDDQSASHPSVGFAPIDSRFLHES